MPASSPGWGAGLRRQPRHARGGDARQRLTGRRWGPRPRGCVRRGCGAWGHGSGAQRARRAEVAARAERRFPSAVSRQRVSVAIKAAPWWRSGARRGRAGSRGWRCSAPPPRRAAVVRSAGGAGRGRKGRGFVEEGRGLQGGAGLRRPRVLRGAACPGAAGAGVALRVSRAPGGLRFSSPLL